VRSIFLLFRLFYPLIIIALLFVYVMASAKIEVSGLSIFSGESQSLIAGFGRNQLLSGVALTDVDAQEKPRSGTVTLLEINRTVSVDLMRDFLNRSARQDGFFVWSAPQSDQYSASAPGVDNIHYVVNGFLQGYKPYQADSVFLPLQVLSRKKKYQFDHITYQGRQEVWQTSKQAFYFPRGDCEDHAIALADWLIESGHDARVVLGDYNGDGHAWVILFKDNKEYILEATDKSYRSKKYPLAKFQPKYHPQWMFNQTEFWTNTGAIFTTDYSSAQWIKKSRYNRS
jgi:hypothetical protein